MKDYRVKTRVELSTGFPEGEFNLLMFEKTKKQMTEKIADIMKENDLLSYYIEGDLSFHFCGYKMCLEYIFTCHDDSRKEAESFSRYAMERLRDQLEKNGYRIEHIYCRARSIDEKEIQRLEERFF